MNAHRRCRGFTLVELLVVIAIIGILASIYLLNVSGKTDKARVAAAKAHIEQLETAIIEFQADNGFLPDSLRDLIEKPAGASVFPPGGYLKGKKVPTDPWTSEYRYVKSGSQFEIICLGADRREGGTGYDADLSSRD